MLFRSWLTFTVVIAVVQGALATLSVFQHDAIFSDLLQKRMSVMAQTVAASFQPFIDLGLPLAQSRNGKALVARPLGIDPEIAAVHAFNPTGIVVHSTLDPKPQTVPRDVLQAMQLSDGVKWSVETSDQVFSGFNVMRGETVAGAVVVAYPTQRLDAASQAIRAETFLSAFMIWLVSSALAYVLLHFLTAAPQRAVAGLEERFRKDRSSGQGGGSAPADAAAGGRLFGQAIEQLNTDIAAATRRFEQVERALKALVPAGVAERGAAKDADETMRRAPEESVVSSSANRALARQLAGRLTTVSAIFIAVSSLILGGLILRSVNNSIVPELAGRTNLIGTVVSQNVERAVAAGIPIDELIGAEDYFGDMLEQLPEVAYIAVATGRIVLEAGQRIDPYLAPPRERKGVRSHPIIHDGEEIAYVVIDIDPAFITKRFRDVFLDVSVVVLVTILLSLEITVLMISRSLTAGLDRLQLLAAMQAAGDFSKRVRLVARGAVGRITATLVGQADRLRRLYVEAPLGSTNPKGGAAEIKRFGQRYGLMPETARTLRISYFTDLRLPLFLFAAAGQLPLSFLPIYTRAAGNPPPWLDESVVISLPLAGYLLAMMLATPFSRPLAERFGRRRLLILAAAPTLIAQIGLFLASTVAEIVLWRTLTGVGYALVTLACQDYVIDTAPRDERGRSLAMFSAVLFAGVFSGAALGGVMADRLGQANVFLLSAVLIATSAALVPWLVAPSTRAKSTDHTELPRIINALRHRPFAALVFAIAIPMNVMVQAFTAYLVAVTLDWLGASTADIGRTLMLYFVGAITAAWFAARTGGLAIPAPLTAVGGQVAAALSILPVAIWPGQLTMAGAVLGAGIAHGFVRGGQGAIAMEIADSDLTELGRTSVLAALRTLERGGSIVGLLVIAALAGFMGYSWAIAAIAAWSFAGAMPTCPSRLRRSRHDSRTLGVKKYDGDVETGTGTGAGRAAHGRGIDRIGGDQAHSGSVFPRL